VRLIRISVMNLILPQPATASSGTTTALRIASVSYLNAKPLLWGVNRLDDVQLHLDVPSKLLDRIKLRQADIALLPVIDYLRLDDLAIVPAGGIGCDGPTLTVRIFSKVPIHQITTLACDTDSHTSVALARIILAEKYGINPALPDLSKDAVAEDEARLLIGDKVVCDEPVGFDHQLDLGAAWKELTGLPFVFAVWMTRKGTSLGDLPVRLAKARIAGLEHVDEIVTAYAVPAGWPAGVAREYLTKHLHFEIGPRQMTAIRLFHQLAQKHDIVSESRELQTA